MVETGAISEHGLPSAGSEIIKAAKQLTKHMAAATISLQVAVYIRPEKRHPIPAQLVGLDQDRNSCFVAASLLMLAACTGLWSELRQAAKEHEASQPDTY